MTLWGIKSAKQEFPRYTSKSDLFHAVFVSLDVLFHTARPMFLARQEKMKHQQCRHQWSRYPIGWAKLQTCPAQFICKHL